MVRYIAKIMKHIKINGLRAGVLVLGLYCCTPLLGCFPKQSEDTQQHEEPMENTIAKQIRINELGEALIQLSEGKTQYDFIGITSNGTDCLYIVRNGVNFDIEFEAITDSQLPFMAQLQLFAEANGFGTVNTTYGNKPDYDRAEAPVIRITTATNPDSTANIVEKIQKGIFANDRNTLYDVVP